MLEKLAPTWLGGVAAIVKPATETAYLTQAMVKAMQDSGIVPEGAIQVICGSVGDMFEHLEYQDVVTFTGSAQTGQMLRSHPSITQKSIPFTMEADSLNCAILGADVTPDMPEFALFVREVTREMTVKAGQKCTAIRRAIVPEHLIDEVATALTSKLEKVVVGDPAIEGVKMGALVSKSQLDDVKEKVTTLSNYCDVLTGGNTSDMSVQGPSEGAFYPPTLLRCNNPHEVEEVHSVEAFGPVCTLMPYSDLSDAAVLAKKVRAA